MSDALEPCGYCGKSFSTRMRHCPFCGGERLRRRTRTVPRCPRCDVDMVRYSYRGAALDTCPSCRGTWLHSRDFRRLTSRRDVYRDDSIPFEHRRAPLEETHEYLPCPECGTIMNRTNFKKISGVLIDICRDHGVWLDAGELEQIRSFVANGGLDELHEKEIFMNAQELEFLKGRVRETKGVEKILHPFNFKRFLFRNL